MSTEAPVPVNAAGAIDQVPIAPAPVPALVQIPESELADLRRRADRYRFLFRTIVTVVSIVVAALVAVVLIAVGIDT